MNFNLLRFGGHEMGSLDMTGPEALTMAGVAERISIAIGRKVTYEPITPEERRGALLASGVPTGFADALDEQLLERLRRSESKVDLATHRAFGVRPTTFAEFAADHAAAFRGEICRELMPSSARLPPASPHGPLRFNRIMAALPGISAIGC